MIVVDTNILIYFALKGAKTGSMERLVQRDAMWAAPFLWRSEFRNVMAGYVRRKEFTADKAAGATLIAADQLLAGEHSVEDEDVFELVRTSRCTAYDCEFVALAFALGTRLVTEDRQVLREFPGVCVSVTEALAG